MSLIPSFGKQVRPLTQQEEANKKLKLVRAGHSIASSAIQGDLDKAFAKTIVSGIKLAADLNAFTNPNTNPLTLVKELRQFGLEVLAWKPETLFSAIDKKYNGWSEEKAHAALEKFQTTGEIITDVPTLIRQKIYAIRIIATSDTAHNEWHVFEKVGCAFNDRLAQFGIVERLSAGECARTISIIENIRPDQYSKEVKIYIAACAHEDGFLTIGASKYLKMACDYLQTMNFESTGERLKPEFADKIKAKVEDFKKHHAAITAAIEDVATIQALKIFSVDLMGDQASEGQ